MGTPSPGVICKTSDDGEIMIKTPAATIGYYKETKLTDELFDEEGYMRTGDKGEVDDRGRLRITGRIKEIFKISKGKYVAPAPIEDLLLQNQNIEQVCVTGASLPQPIALITLNELSLVSSGTPQGRVSITESLQETAESVNTVLDKHENISCLVVISDQWTVETGIMTPTLKVKHSPRHPTRKPQCRRRSHIGLRSLKVG